MANRQVPASLRGIVRFREQRVFRCHFICDECPLEWMDEMLTQSSSWCPCCDGERQPYLVEEIYEERAEFDIDDGEIE